MNKYQRITLIALIISIAVMALFPPHKLIASGRVFSAGYYFIGTLNHKYLVDIPLLLTQVLIAIVIGGIIWKLFEGKKQ